MAQLDLTGVRPGDIFILCEDPDDPLLEDFIVYERTSDMFMHCLRNSDGTDGSSQHHMQNSDFNDSLLTMRIPPEKQDQARMLAAHRAWKKLRQLAV